VNDLLYINGSLIDLDAKQIIAVTLKSIEIGKLDTRTVTHTNQFNVPHTANNDRIFGYVSSERSLSSVPYAYQTCKLIQNGIEVIVGTCIVKGYNNGFKINIFEDLFDVFATLKGKKLSDINPIADSEWNAEAMDNARDNTEGIVAPLLFWGHSTAVPFESAYFLPCFYYHTIIKNILQYTGLTLSGDILTDARFTDLVVPFCGDEFNIPLNVVTVAPEYIGKGDVDGNTTAEIYPEYPASGVLEGDSFIMLAVSDQLGVTIGTINTPTGWTQEAIGGFNNSAVAAVGIGAVFYREADGTENGGFVTLQRTGDTGGSTTFTAIIYHYRGDNVVVEDAVVKTNGNGNTTITFDAVTVGGSHRTLLAMVGQKDSISIGTPTGYTARATDSDGLNMTLDLKDYEDVSSDGSVTTTGGRTDGWISFHVSIYNATPTDVDWNLYWPDVDVLDLVRDFFVRYGIIPKQKFGVLYLKTVQAIFSDRTNVNDWRDKLVKGNGPISFSLDYGQNNNFDYVNTQNDPTLGRGVLTISNETLPLEKTEFSSPFEQCEDLDSAGGYIMASIPVFTSESTDITDIEGSPGLKLLTLKSRTTEDPVTFYVTARTDYKLAYFINASLTKDSNLQYFLNQFYPLLTAALQKNKVITKEYYLNPLDIKNYDSHKMIYDGEGYYYVNKISNFVAGQVTKVELFKIA